MVLKGVDTLDNQNNYKSCLFKVPIFSHLNLDEQNEISMLATVRKLSKGEVLYNMGDVGSSLFVVHKGKIKISRHNEEGNEQVIRILNSGDFLGEELLFLNTHTENFAVAIDDSAICVLEGTKLKKHILDKPQIGIRIISELSQRLSETESKLESYNLDLTEKRIVTSILELSLDSHQLKLPYSKADWASMLGMTPETLSRKLAKLKNQNLIELDGQRVIKIRNKKKLMDLID